MNEELWEILWHTLGMNSPYQRRRRSLAWWLDNDNHRNHYAAEPRGEAIGHLDALIRLGYMEKGRDIPGGLVYYHVTDEGIEAAHREFHGRKGRGAAPPGGPSR